MLAVPAVVELVSTTMATPLASVVVELVAKLPLVVVQATAKPGTPFPLASRTVAVRVLVEVPFATIDDGEAVTATVEAAPAVKVTAAVSDALPTVARTVAAPEVVDVRPTMATPDWLMVDVELASEPRLVDQLTTPLVTVLPFASRTTARNTETDEPSACTTSGVAVSATVAAGPFTNVTGWLACAPAPRCPRRGKRLSRPRRWPGLPGRTRCCVPGS